MKKRLKEILSGGMFMSIAGHQINWPVGQPWDSIDDVIDNIGEIINGVIILSSVVAVVMMIVGGYTLIMSGGDPDKAQQGQKTLTGAIVGLVVVWIVWLIIKFVLDFLFGPS